MHKKSVFGGGKDFGEVDSVELALLFRSPVGGLANALGMLEEVVVLFLGSSGIGFVVAEETLVDEGIQLAADVVGLTGEPSGEFADSPTLGFEFEPSLVDEGKEEELKALEVEVEEHPTFDLECAELVHEREFGFGFTILFCHNLIVLVVFCAKKVVFFGKSCIGEVCFLYARGMHSI